MSEPRRVGLRAGVALLLLGYLAAGLSQIRTTDAEYDHVFPFIAWNMFAYAPPRGQFAVMISVNGGHRYDSPKPLDEAIGGPPKLRSDALHMANMLGGAVEMRSPSRVEAARRDIETKLLRRPFSYAVFDGDRKIAEWTAR